MRRRHRFWKSMQFAAIGLALLWSLAPLYWMIATSLKTELEASSTRR